MLLLHLVEPLEYLVELVLGHSPSGVVVVDAVRAVLTAVGDMDARAVAGVLHGIFEQIAENRFTAGDGNR